MQQFYFPALSTACPNMSELYMLYWTPDTSLNVNAKKLKNRFFFVILRAKIWTNLKSLNQRHKDERTWRAWIRGTKPPRIMLKKYVKNSPISRNIHFCSTKKTIVKFNEWISYISKIQKNSNWDLEKNSSHKLKWNTDKINFSWP